MKRMLTTRQRECNSFLAPSPAVVRAHASLASRHALARPFARSLATRFVGSVDYHTIDLDCAYHIIIQCWTEFMTGPLLEHKQLLHTRRAHQLGSRRDRPVCTAWLASWLDGLECVCQKRYVMQCIELVRSHTTYAAQ
jgi:hypothetical protein